MTSFVYLDGKRVDPNTIDPLMHRFLGMFRPARNPFENPNCDILCTCGDMLRYRGQEIEHYKRGCYDVPQYAML